MHLILASTITGKLSIAGRIFYQCAQGRFQKAHDQNPKEFCLLSRNENCVRMHQLKGPMLLGKDNTHRPYRKQTVSTAPCLQFL